MCILGQCTVRAASCLCASGWSLIGQTLVQSETTDVWRKLGSFTWLAIAMVCTEVLLVIKLGHGEFTAPFPENVKLAWGIFAVVFGVSMGAWQVTIWVKSYQRKATPHTAPKKQQ